MIDPNFPPLIVDKTVLFTTREWTGIALIPDRPPGWPVRMAWGAIGGVAVAGLGWIGARLKGRLAR